MIVVSRHRGGRRGRGFTSALGYALSLVLLAILSLVVIPLLISGGGSEGWSAIAVGQAVGLVAAVILEYGWGFHGPATVARIRDDFSAIVVEVREANKVRASALLPLGVLGATLSALLFQDSAMYAAAGFLSTFVLGLRLNWVFIGLHSPGRLFALETVPRAVGLLGSIVVLTFAEGGVVLALLLQAFGVVAGTLIGTAWVEKQAHGMVPPARPVRELLRVHFPGVLGLSISGVWSSLPTLVVAVVAPGAVASLALVLRVFSQANTGLSPLVNVLQATVPRASAHATVARFWRAFRMSVAIAVLAAAAVIVAREPLFAFLGAGVVSPSDAEVWLLGLLVMLSFLAQVVTRVGLASLGKGDSYARGVLTSVVIGIALLLTLVGPLEGVGALISMVGMLVTQLSIGLYHIRTSARGS